MLRIYHLLANGDPELAELLELKSVVRGAVRARGGMRLPVRFEGVDYTLKVSPSGGLEVSQDDDRGRPVSDHVVLSILRILTEDV